VGTHPTHELNGKEKEKEKEKATSLSRNKICVTASISSKVLKLFERITEVSTELPYYTLQYKHLCLFDVSVRMTASRDIDYLLIYWAIWLPYDQLSSRACRHSMQLVIVFYIKGKVF
jgi:hypothetical protein